MNWKDWASNISLMWIYFLSSSSIEVESAVAELVNALIQNGHHGGVVSGEEPVTAYILDLNSLALLQT